MIGSDASGPDVDGAVERAFRELQEPGVASVYLFGSHAGGRSHRESDVDVAVAVLLRHAVHPTPRDRFETRLRLSGRLGARLGRDCVGVVERFVEVVRTIEGA